MPGLLLLLAQVAVTAQAPPAASPRSASAAPDNRLFGHIPYPEAAAVDLSSAPAGFELGQPCRVQRDLVADLARLLAAHAASGTGDRLVGLSCYRGVGHQHAVFCKPGRDCTDPAQRARYVAPPGYSEHATGYAIDFGVRPQGGCRDTSDCIAGTPAGRWLLANAPRFGFELSFPPANVQGVTWEPWHWRWVGTNGDSAGAIRARRLFANARAHFPASPRVLPLPVRVAFQPPVPFVFFRTQPPPVPREDSRARRLRKQADRAIAQAARAARQQAKAAR